MKKGLKPQTAAGMPANGRPNDALMKKGLKQHQAVEAEQVGCPNDALMKKGLKRDEKCEVLEQIARGLIEIPSPYPLPEGEGGRERNSSQEALILSAGSPLSPSLPQENASIHLSSSEHTYHSACLTGNALSFPPSLRES